MHEDLTDLLRKWEYDPYDTVRFLTADDGREIMQVRLPLGVEQYELDGRPDGKRPYGKESALREYQDKLEQALNEEGSYTLSEDDFAELQNEGILFYYRYLVLFQKGDYRRTARDTDHNLAITTLVETYFEDDEKKQLLQYKPYILRVNTIAKAMIALETGKADLAKEYIHSAMSAILEMPKVDTPVFEFEKIRSVQQLQEILKQLQEHHPDPKEELEAQLRQAVEEENYEQAAHLRDQIREITREKPSPDHGGFGMHTEFTFDPQTLDELTTSSREEPSADDSDDASNDTHDNPEPHADR
jgi:hypothetical protein